MAPYFFDPKGSAEFLPEKFGKLELARGEQLFLGLNCFEPGQAQPVHSHRGADKFYLILSGNARLVVGEETRDAGPGMLIWAPRGIPHGVERVYERTVMLVGMAPPP